MKVPAIRVHETGGPEVLRLEEIEVGDPGPGQLRIRLPDSVKAGLYVLEAFNVHGDKVAQSIAFEIS